jgi:ABC-2 type transport system permease protein
MGAVYIMWIRQLKRYFRSKSRIAGSLGQPLLFMIAFGFGLGPVFAQAGQGNYIEFLVPGVVAMTLLFTSISSGIEIIWDRQFGFLKETLVAPVSRLSIMIGRTLGGASLAVMQGIFVMLLSLIIGFKIMSTGTFLLALIFMTLIAITFTAMGTAIASRMQDFHGFQLILNFLVMPLFFLSGAMFPVKNLPPVFSFIVKIDPLSYGVDGLRGALTGTYAFGPVVDLTVLIIVATFFTVLGSIMFSKIEV